MQPFQSLILLLGVIGGLLFYGRFYLQWVASELRGHSVVPIAFWYMSGVGSAFLLLYGVFYLNSPVGALSHCFNSIIYARNLVHIWRERGVLTPYRSRLFHGGVAILVGAGVLLAALTWLREYEATREATSSAQLRTWAWIVIGVAGQGLFALRFLIQWAATELKRKSVIPPAFWYLSVVASLLLMSSHIQRHEWLYAGGIACTMIVYLRNIYLIHRKHPRTPNLEP